MMVREERSWSVDDIAYGEVERDRVADDGQLFLILASASFVEITSEVYTETLVDFYADDPEVVGWLQGNWGREEVNHGQALRRYVETAWPEFDWQEAYDGFIAEFRQFCSVDQLAPTRALEMASRCVVETGTAAFYRMLSALSPEPVLRRLTALISADEVDHYKHFYRYFRRYRDLERPSRKAVLGALWARMNEIDAEDAYYAFKHVHRVARPGVPFSDADYAAFRRGLRHIGKPHFPFEMAVKMLLRPLDLSPILSRLAVPTLVGTGRAFLLR